MKSLALPFLLFSTAALAQSSPTEFPEGATAVAPEALKGSVADKVFSVKPSKGERWRWQFNANGYFYINIGNFSDSGKWETKDSSLCTEGKQIKASCNEVRAKGAELYLKRDNGEVVKLEVQ